MRLRLGVGGRAFGVRGGISTRGAGVGAGPLSVGTSWRRRRRSGLIAFVTVMSFLFAAACINNLLGDPLHVNQPTPSLAPITTATTRPYAPRPTTTNAPVPTSELQAVPCLADPSRMCMNGTPLIPGTTATITPAPNGWPPPESVSR